ncbi:F0F1 ATP synthase subunit A [Myxococcota bacterium]|nr:F0F1 ATP synthase subunit A [Myxococcota bacterium]
MGEHTTWLDLLPGFQSLQEFLRQYFGRSWSNSFLQKQEHFTLVPVFMSLFVFLIILMVSLRYRKISEDPSFIIPGKKVNFLNITDFILHNLENLTYDISGDRDLTREIFPLIVTIFLFIFTGSMLGMMPGFLPPNSTLQLNLAMALFVFFYTHYLGIKKHSWRYVKQFTGSNIMLAPLMLPIEILSHLSRPLSLTVRLLGNLFAEHKVMAIFTALFPLLLPIPFLFLGILTALIQSLVFMMLSVVYFSLATAEEH